MKPDLVIEDKGRGRFEDFPSALQTVAKSIHDNAFEHFYIRIINDDEYNKATFVLEALSALPSNDWEIDYFLSNDKNPEPADEITMPYEIEIDAKSEKMLVIGFLSPDYFEAGDMANTVITAYQKNNENDKDSVKIICGLPFAWEADVLKEIEMFAKAETLFPKTATYDSSTFLEDALLQESDRLYQLCLEDLNGVTFEKIETAKNIVVYRVICRLLRKAAVYMIGGEAVYLRTQENYEKEIRKLEMFLLARYQ